MKNHTVQANHNNKIKSLTLITDLIFFTIIIIKIKEITTFFSVFVFPSTKQSFTSYNKQEKNSEKEDAKKTLF